MSGSPQVSVIVPSYNGARSLGRTLHAISTAAEGLACEVLVVDNNSTDGTAELAAGVPGVRVLAESHPTSYAARNRGIRASRGRILAFTDDDCVPDPGWLRAGLAPFGDDGRGLVVSGPTRGPRGRRGDVQSYLRRAGNNDGRRSSAAGYFPTANLLVARDDAIAVGGFDHRLTSGGDLDFCWRLIELGASLRWEPGCSLVHEHRIDRRGLYRQAYKYGAGARRLHALHSARPPGGDARIRAAIDRGLAPRRNVSGHGLLALVAKVAERNGVAGAGHRLVRRWGFREGYRRAARAARAHELSILAVPDFRHRNGYQESFYAALARRVPVSVSYDDVLDRASLEPLLPYINLVHLSWPEVVAPRIARAGGADELIATLRAARAAGVAVAVTVHNRVGHDSQDAARERANLRAVLAEADRVLCLAEASRVELGAELGVPEERLVGCPHGAYPWIVADHHAAPLRRRFAIPEHGRICLHVGMVKGYKGIVELAASWSRVCPDPDAHLVVLGRVRSRSLRRRLRRSAERDPRVHLGFGFLAPGALAQALAEADCGVFPYTAVLNSGSLVAALQVGLPVAASGGGVVEEYARRYPELVVTVDDWAAQGPTALSAVLAAGRSGQRAAQHGAFLAATDWQRCIGPAAEALAEVVGCALRPAPGPSMPRRLEASGDGDGRLPLRSVAGGPVELERILPASTADEICFQRPVGIGALKEANRLLRLDGDLVVERGGASPQDCARCGFEPAADDPDRRFRLVRKLEVIAIHPAGTAVRRGRVMPSATNAYVVSLDRSGAAPDPLADAVHRVDGDPEAALRALAPSRSLRPYGNAP